MGAVNNKHTNDMQVLACGISSLSDPQIDLCILECRETAAVMWTGGFGPAPSLILRFFGTSR